MIMRVQRIYHLLVLNTVCIYLFAFIIFGSLYSNYKNIIRTQFVKSSYLVILNYTTTKLISNNVNIQIFNWYVSVDNKISLACANYFSEYILYYLWNGQDTITQPSLELNGLPAIFCSRCTDYMCIEYNNYTSIKGYISTEPWTEQDYVFKFDTYPYFPEIKY